MILVKDLLDMNTEELKRYLKMNDRYVFHKDEADVFQVSITGQEIFDLLKSEDNFLDLIKEESEKNYTFKLYRLI